jgi:hypothetical protein
MPTVAHKKTDPIFTCSCAKLWNWSLGGVPSNHSTLRRSSETLSATDAQQSLLVLFSLQHGLNVFRNRVRHANLFGPAGLVSADDSEVITMAQNGYSTAAEGS